MKTTKKLNFSKVSPTGNTTILIWDLVERAQHAQMANVIMGELHLGAEQVGYVEPATSDDVVAHLQMMGGEFCGNATRSLAFMLVSKQEPQIEIKDGLAQFKLSVSGVSHPLEVEVEVDKDNSPISAKIEMPIYTDLNKVCGITISNCETDASIVSMEGITHIIVDENRFPFHSEDKRYQSQLNRLKEEFDLEKEEAVGVMWTKQKDNAIHMKPVVYVKETNSHYYETSCGSGTVAVALAMAKDISDVYQEYDIHQPSGGFITAIVNRDESGFLGAYIKGSVEIIAEGVVHV